MDSNLPRTAHCEFSGWEVRVIIRNLRVWAASVSVEMCGADGTCECHKEMNNTQVNTKILETLYIAINKPFSNSNIVLHSTYIMYILINKQLILKTNDCQ